MNINTLTFRSVPAHWASRLHSQPVKITHNKTFSISSWIKCNIISYKAVCVCDGMKCKEKFAAIWLCLSDVESPYGLGWRGEWQDFTQADDWGTVCVCVFCLNNSKLVFIYCRPEISCLHAQSVVVRVIVSIGVSGFSLNFALASGLTGVIQEVAVWLSRACPHFEKFEAPEARAPFSPTAAPELCLTLHTKWRLCVTNWFQLAVAMVSTLEGAVGGRRGQQGWWVCHMTTEKCLMSCDVFGRAINTHTLMWWQFKWDRKRGLSWKCVGSVWGISQVHRSVTFGPGLTLTIGLCAYSLQGDYPLGTKDLIYVGQLFKTIAEM